MGYDRVTKGINECLCLTTKLTDFLKKCCHSGKEKPTFKRERAGAGPGSWWDASADAWLPNFCCSSESGYQSLD